MKLFIIFSLLLTACLSSFFTRVKVFDDCIDDRTGEFDLGGCHIFLDDICKDIDEFCIPFKKNNNSKCLNQAAEACKEHKEKKNE